MIKKIFTFCFILLNLNVGFSSEIDNELDVPHYKKYKATPVIDYQEAVLDFYSVKTNYGEFSNFGLFPIEIDGVIWPSSEHYYQAQKYTDPEIIERVRMATSPFEAAKLGRDPLLPKKENWIELRDSVMQTALDAKFSQYSILRKLLISTGQSQIYEHTENDCYWADCGDRTGKNRLGQMLMEIRNRLKSPIIN